MSKRQKIIIVTLHEFCATQFKKQKNVETYHEWKQDGAAFFAQLGLPQSPILSEQHPELTVATHCGILC